MSKLTLYFSPSCGYCAKVLRFIEENDIKLSLANVVESSQTCEELISIGGKSQVPCLVIDGKALYESDDIIEWLKENAQP